MYCSVICPLGVMQDIVSWASGKRRKHRNRFAYSPALTWLRRGCSSCSSPRCWRVSVRCSRLTAPTAASPRTCWPRSTRGATTCWHTSPGAWTATPSIRSTSG
uniref:4Fe-4S binding protein n=1 Tax=Alistipes shahii TaxID=328814 RepID=UPI003FEF4E80